MRQIQSAEPFIQQMDSLGSLKNSGSSQELTSWKIKGQDKRLKRHNNQMQCLTLDWILNEGEKKHKTDLKKDSWRNLDCILDDIMELTFS